jgi:tRNA pseudouridine32 synthase/23S rRNA pseudouridine746 synthase
VIAPEILFQDNRFIVINKPAGLPVHASRGGGLRGTGGNVEDFFPYFARGKSGPWLAHRLDRDTAGCLVIALKKSALIAAQTLFANGGVEKTYWAIVTGTPSRSAGEIDLPLGKVTSGRNWKMAAATGAQPAFTRWRLRGAGSGFSWLELHPKTGRTHQIRAHCAAIGHPIIGDAVYGSGGGPLCLLARAILLPLDPPVGAISPVPPHMEKGLKSCGWTENDQK